MKDFRKTLNQFYSIRNNIYDKSYYIDNLLYKPSTNFSMKLTIPTENLSEISNDNSIDFDEYLEDDYNSDNKGKYIIKNKEINYFENNQNNNNIKHIFSFSINDEIEKLKNINEKLFNSNSNLLLENSQIESEIFLYQSKPINYTQLKKGINAYDESLTKFINSIKSSLKKYINENLQLIDKIFNFQKKTQLQFMNNKKQMDIYEKIIQIIKNKNEKISDIQKYNKENKLRYNNLIKEKEKLNKKLENFKIKLYELKSKEKILTIKHEKNSKSKHDQVDLISNLYKIINFYVNNDKEENFNKSNKLKLINDSLILNEEKIQQLFSNISRIEKEKYAIESENRKISNEIKNMEEKQNYRKLEDLKNELNELKIVHFNILKNIEVKEQEIKKLKYANDKWEDLKFNNKKLELNNHQLLKNNRKEDKLIINLIDDNEINEEIKKVSKINKEIINEIKSSSKKYNNILYKKEQAIYYLEKQFKQKIDDKIKLIYQ